jgi:hypothetical protein
VQRLDPDASSWAPWRPRRQAASTQPVAVAPDTGKFRHVKVDHGQALLSIHSKECGVHFLYKLVSSAPYHGAIALLVLAQLAAVFHGHGVDWLAVLEVT